MSKIAFLSFYSGFVERGVETYVCELAMRLAKKHEVTVFQVSKSHNFYTSTKISVHKFKVIDLESLNKIPQGSGGFFKKFYLDWWSLKILLFSFKAAFKVTRGR